MTQENQQIGKQEEQIPALLGKIERICSINDFPIQILDKGMEGEAPISKYLRLGGEVSPLFPHLHALLGRTGDDRLETLRWLNNGSYLHSVFPSLPRAEPSLRNLRKAFEDEFGIFDGEKGLLLRLFVEGQSPQAADAQLEKVIAYAEKIVHDRKVGGGLVLEASRVLPISLEMKKRVVAYIRWSEQHRATIQEQVSSTINRLLVQKEGGRRGNDDEEEKKKVYIHEPVKIASAGDAAQYGERGHALMVGSYEAARDQGAFQALPPSARLPILLQDFFPIASVYRDQALQEQVQDLKALSTEELFVLRDAFSDVRHVDRVAATIMERLESEGQTAGFNHFMAAQADSAALLRTLEIESIASAPVWKQELFTVLCLYPYPSYRRDELLNNIANRKPRPGEADRDLPATSADMGLMNEWYVQTGVLRKDEQATSRMLELEMILNGIRQLDRQERISLLLFFMGIEIDNEAKRAIEMRVRRQFPSFSIEGSNLSQQEMDQLLLELFEGEVSGIFTQASEEDAGKPDRFLREIAQRVVNKGQERTQLQLSNLIYRIFQSAHWKKRLRITQEIFRYSQKGGISEERFVTLFICSLGAAFVKGSQQEGQKSWVPRRFREALMDVFDNAPLPPKATMLEVVDREIGLDHFEGIYEPLACASTAVVYRARLKTGQEVAVKVIKPNAIAEIEWDIELIRDLIRFVNTNQELYGIFLPESLADEIHQSLIIQLDLRNERSSQANYAQAVDLLKKELSTQPVSVSVTSAIGDEQLQSRKVAVYELAEGIPLTDWKKIEAYADFVGMELSEVRRQIHTALGIVQVGTLLKADHLQADPNPGNAMIVPYFSAKAPAALREKCRQAIRSIVAGEAVGEEINVRESRLFQLGLKLLDFGAIQEIPQLYREQLHHLLWAFICGDMKAIKDLIVEFHISTHLADQEASFANLAKVPPLDLVTFEESLIELFETYFGDTIHELLRAAESEEITRDRFSAILQSLVEKQNIGNLFQEVLALFEEHQLRIPPEIMAILKSFRIGAYIFQEVPMEAIIEEFKRVLPASTFDHIRDRGAAIMKKIIGAKAMTLIKKGVRDFAALKVAFRGKQPEQKTLAEILVDRLKAAKLDEWFQILKPKERVHARIDAKQIETYRQATSGKEAKKTEKKTDSSTKLGIEQIHPALRVDSLGPGTILKYKANGQIHTIAVTRRAYLTHQRGIADCIREDGSDVRINIPFVLAKSLVMIAGKWYRGDQLIKIHHPGQEVKMPDYEGVTTEIPPAITSFFRSAELQQDEMVDHEKIKNEFDDQSKKKKKKKRRDHDEHTDWVQREYFGRDVKKDDRD